MSSVEIFYHEEDEKKCAECGRMGSYWEIILSATKTIFLGPECMKKYFRAPAKGEKWINGWFLNEKRNRVLWVMAGGVQLFRWVISKTKEGDKYLLTVGFETIKDRHLKYETFNTIAEAKARAFPKTKEWMEREGLVGLHRMERSHDFLKMIAQAIG